MSFVITTPPTPMTTPHPLAAVNYYVTINQLSARNAPEAKEEIVAYPQVPFGDMLVPLIPYAPVFLFVLLFTVAFGMQVVNKIRRARHMMVAILIAFFAASIPTVLNYVQQGTRQEARAGPEEVPRQVRVAPQSPGSVVISWETDAPRVGVVRFGKKPLTNASGRVYIGNDQMSVRMHSVQIDTLTKKQPYQFEIMSGNTWYDNNGKYIEFTY